MRTVDIQKICDGFERNLHVMHSYINCCETVFADDKKYLSFSYEYAIISIYKDFEQFILRTMIYCLNHNHTHFESKYKIRLGTHINDDVCEFLVTKGGYFDFKGRGGLNKALNDVIGTNHNICKTIKNNKHKSTIERLCALRNYAAHNSIQAKQSAMDAFQLKRISSAGSFLKKQNRLDEIINGLITLSNDVRTTTI